MSEGMIEVLPTQWIYNLFGNVVHNDAKCVDIEAWEPDHMNQYDNWYSLMTDIIEDNWQQKFSGEEEDGADPEHCPRSLLFFEIQPGEKVFVEGYEV